MGSLDEELDRRLGAIREAGLHRSLRTLESPQGTVVRWEGRGFLNFSSNDYLGLAADPRVIAGACRATEQFGGGAGASRLICGSMELHERLEAGLAAFKGTEAALLFSSGYTAALGTIGALMGAGDEVVVDRLAHACLVDAARLSGARLRVFAHNDMTELERILQRASARGQAGPVGGEERPGAEGGTRVLIVTESVFSMDGDRAPLADLVVLKERYGAWLLVDEAHATGIYGRGRRGGVEEAGIEPGRIEVQMGTLGKALGAGGGFVAGSRRLREFLINRARSFIFSTAPVPAAMGAALAALEIVEGSEGEDRCRRLWSNVAGLGGGGGPIVPVMVGAETAAVEAARRLFEQGFFVPAIRYPTVARGRARLRVTLSAAHSEEQVEALKRALEGLGLSTGGGAA